MEQKDARRNNGTAIGFKLLWTEVNLVVTDESREIDCGTGFACKGGEFCIDNGHNVCAERMRLCINESLKCNGLLNCAENDSSDEDFCYPEEFFMYLCIAIVIVLMLCVAGCLIHCMLKLCRANNSTPQTNHKKASISSHHRQPNPSKQELLDVSNKNAVPKQSITVVTSTKRRSRNSDITNDLPVWQLDSNNVSSINRFNNLRRAQV